MFNNWYLLRIVGDYDLVQVVSACRTKRDAQVQMNAIKEVVDVPRVRIWYKILEAPASLSNYQIQHLVSTHVD